VKTFQLSANAQTCHWGYFDARREAVLSIESGDTVVIDTVTGPDWTMPDTALFHIPHGLAEIHAKLPAEGPHILTGPVHVAGARPGSVLEVRIEKVQLLQDWGFNLTLVNSGMLPGEFEQRLVNIPLDDDRRVATLPWGLELPLSPFFGVMGVAPPQEWGRISSIEPRAMGGNMDNRELVAGTTLYLPVFNEGGRFSCGDGHALQGDGEANTTAIETALRGTFQFIVRDDLGLAMPRAETPSHYITMGFGPDLDDCAVVALRDMIALITERSGLSRHDAYMLCSLTTEMRVTQAVNGHKGIHMTLAKALLTAKGDSHAQ
jgi:acetamidase/formamidase